MQRQSHSQISQHPLRVDEEGRLSEEDTSRQVPRLAGDQSEMSCSVFKLHVSFCRAFSCFSPQKFQQHRAFSNVLFVNTLATS